MTLEQTQNGVFDRRRNALLARLPAEDDARLAALLEPVSLDVRDTVERQGEPLAAVYFPLDGIVSVVDSSEAGGEVEITTIGNEGVAGMQAFLGAAVNTYDTFCQVPGRLLRLSVPQLNQFLAEDGALHRLFRQYAQVTIAQLSRNVLCHQLHRAEVRAARWLLMTHDRVGADEFTLTQEFFAQMMGVRRMTISEIASSFRQRGLIDYTRGRITISDRAGLEAASCSCYRILTEQTNHLLDQDAPSLSHP